jgi:hypothetical protein
MKYLTPNQNTPPLQRRLEPITSRMHERELSDKLKNVMGSSLCWGGIDLLLFHIFQFDQVRIQVCFEHLNHN